MELLPNRSISSGVDGQDRIGRGLPSGPIQQWGDESIQIVGARTMLTSMIIWINGAKLRPRGSTQRLWCKWPQRYVHVRPVGEENKIVLHFIPKGGRHSSPLHVDKPVMAESCWELNVNKCSCAVSNSEARLQPRWRTRSSAGNYYCQSICPGGDDRERNEWFQGALWTPK